MPVLSYAEAMRLKRERIALANATRNRGRKGSVADFWDCVNTAAGADECHPWTGSITPTWTVYPVGKFELEGCETTLAHRIACFLTFGREVPKDRDVAPLCDNHLCCNVRHLMVLPSNRVPGSATDRSERAVMAEEFFCVAVAA